MVIVINRRRKPSKFMTGIRIVNSVLLVLTLGVLLQWIVRAIETTSIVALNIAAWLFVGILFGTCVGETIENMFGDIFNSYSRGW